MDRYHKYVNFIVNGDNMVLVGIKVTPIVSEALYDNDELTWQAYLRLLHNGIDEYNQYLPNVSQDSEA